MFHFCWEFSPQGEASRRKIILAPRLGVSRAQMRDFWCIYIYIFMYIYIHYFIIFYLYNLYIYTFDLREISLTHNLISFEHLRPIICCMCILMGVSSLYRLQLGLPTKMGFQSLNTWESQVYDGFLACVRRGHVHRHIRAQSKFQPQRAMVLVCPFFYGTIHGFPI